MKTPTHDDITSRALSLWRERGCPAGCDTEIWLEAERQLNQGPGSTDGQAPASFTERAKAETAAESVVEFQISPAGSDDDAIRAAMQKQDPRAPQAKPPMFGKSLSKKLRPPQN